MSGEPIPIWRKATARALVESCPAPYDRTLDAICRIALSTGELFAAPATIAKVAKSSRATVLRHRTWLAEHGYMRKLGGGYRGRIARYAVSGLSAKSLKESQNETLSTLKRVSKRDADPVVPAHVVNAGTTTHAIASSVAARTPLEGRPLEDGSVYRDGRWQSS